MQSIQNHTPVIQQKTVLDMKIMKMDVQPTGVYKDQFYRPLTLGATQQQLQSLGNQLDQVNGRITDLDFNAFAATALQPSTEVMGGVFIPNGWNNERFSFQLIVHIQTSMGMHEERLIGWSERRDVSYNNLVDENMYFHVNSVTRRRLLSVESQYGSYNTFQTIDSSQIFYEPELVNSYNNDNTPKLIRPYDLYGRLAINNIDPTQSWVREFGSSMSGPGTILDTRGSLAGIPLTSRRSNMLGGNYLSRTFQAYDTANISQQSGASEHSYADPGAIWSEARKDPGIREVPISDSEFLQLLSGNHGHQAILPYFTLKDLYRIDPVLASSTDQRIAINDQSLATSPHSSSNWNTKAPTAIAAYHLAQAIPAILARVGAFGVSVIMQNRDGTVPGVQIVGHTEMMANLVPVVEKAIETEVLPMLTMNNNRAVFATYSTPSIYQNATIQISFNSDPMELFDVPQFADSRFSPIISNENGASNMAQAVGATLMRLGRPISTDFSGHTPLDLSQSMQIQTAASQAPREVAILNSMGFPQATPQEAQLGTNFGGNPFSGFGGFSNSDTRLI